MTQCPLCREPLRLVIENNVDIDVCDGCHSIWLDPGEIDTIAKGNDFSIRNFSSEETLELICPRCSTRNFVAIQTKLGAFAQCADCRGVFVGSETLDCISNTERSVLPSKATAETVLMSTDLLSGLVELLWIFSHH